MTGKEFANRVAHGSRDIVEEFVRILSRERVGYCVIGGLAVNAYAEPVVSLDLDLVIAVDDRNRLIATLPKDYNVRVEKHSINVAASGSDLRIQLQTDPRYEEFIARAQERDVLGYRLKVAALADVLQGKLWAYSDSERRPSKRQKDLADIMRLLESNPGLEKTPPGEIARSLISRL